MIGSTRRDRRGGTDAAVGYDPAVFLQTLPSPPEIEAALLRFAAWPRVVLLDSARRGDRQSQWSFLTAAPLRTQTIDAGGRDAIEPRRDRRLPAEAPPFCGGLVGVLSYEFGLGLEASLHRPSIDEFGLPVAELAEYDWALAWNHADGTCWLAAEDDGRAADVRRTLRGDPPPDGEWVERFPRGAPVTIRSPQHPLDDDASEHLVSNFTRDGYLNAVEAMRQAIAAGDIFQANLAQRLLARPDVDPLTLYRRLRRRSPAPMAAFVDAGSYRLLSTSPERFLKIDARHIETRPIKGTYRRVARPEADLFTRDALRESAKDRAENVMIVDLLRNDLSRVCQTGSMRVPSLCQIETFANVQHLVSVVTADLRDDLTPLDALLATFPGGSITGCPKIEAMNWIAKLEQVARGPYCGSLFYWGYERDGVGAAFDSSILIRTVIDAGGWWQLPVGGGITWPSDPAGEYQETLDKATAMRSAIAHSD